MINSQQECRLMIAEIEESGENLTDWESQFIDSVVTVDNLSVKQREIIDRIHDKTVVGPWKLMHRY